MDSFDDPFADSNDVFDDDDPFSYSKSKAQEKSSFMSYTKDGSSAAGGADMSGMSLKERAKMMLSASRNSSKSKQSSKSAKKKNHGNLLFSKKHFSIVFYKFYLLARNLR